MAKHKIVILLLVAFILGACDFQEPAPFTATPQPPKTNTPIPTDTPTIIPPTETPIPSPTIPPDLWLDEISYELSVQHPLSTAQPEWGSSGEITIPADGMVGGFVFTVDEVTGPWGPAQSTSVDSEHSIMRGGSTFNHPPGAYCVSDYIPKYNPASVCQWLAPEATHLDWITSYFAGPKTEVGIAFKVGACDPANCTAFLKVTNIRLIYYALSE